MAETRRRSSWNGSVRWSTRSAASSLTSLPMSTSRSLSQSPSPSCSSTDMTTSTLVLNCRMRSASSSTGPSWIPSKVTPKRSSKVPARATKYGTFIFIS